MTSPHEPNRLDESAARQPGRNLHGPSRVNWLPWSQETFDKAKRENKPVFLSIGFP